MQRLGTRPIPTYKGIQICTATTSWLGCYWTYGGRWTAQRGRIYPSRFDVCGGRCRYMPDSRSQGSLSQTGVLDASVNNRVRVPCEDESVEKYPRSLMVYVRFWLTPSLGLTV